MARSRVLPPRWLSVLVAVLVAGAVCSAHSNVAMAATTSAPQDGVPVSGEGLSPVELTQIDGDLFGDISSACPSDILLHLVLTDVATNDVHRPAIVCMVRWDVARGLSDSEFGPGLPVTRDQMASFIARLIEKSGGTLPVTVPDAFSDDDGSVHEERINQLASAGVITGTRRGTYAPRNVVRRDQMASFLVRAYQYRTGTTLEPAENAFGDDDDSVHEDSIDKSAAAGFTEGVSSGSYAPERSVVRNAMSSFLARLLERLVEDGLATVPLPAPSPTPAPNIPSPPPVTGAPAPGSVGFLGDPTSLRVIDGSSPTPPGTSWQSGPGQNYLRIHADNVALDGVYVKGGIDFYGAGTLTIRNSIVEGGWGSWMVVLGRTSGSTLDVRDSTLRWRAGATPSVGYGNGAIQIAASVKIIAMRNDISGAADGIQLAGDDSRVEQNWIHDLATLGDYPNNTHNDGIQMYHGERVVIADNRIEIGFDKVHQNAAVFLQPGNGNAIPGIRITGNYLQGGGFTLRLEGSTTTNAVVSDNVFGPLEGAWGHAYARNGATIAEWSANRQSDGTEVTRPF